MTSENKDNVKSGMPPIPNAFLYVVMWWEKDVIRVIRQTNAKTPVENLAILNECNALSKDMSDFLLKQLSMSESEYKRSEFPHE